ncbi:MAG: MliC family protein [Candidatus Competibacteraceae bacterium]
MSSLTVCAGGAQDGSGTMLRTTTFRCGNRTGSIGFRNNTMYLTVGEETFEMQPVKTASGAKYQATGDPATTFWSKGNRATLVVRGQTYPECTKEGTEAKLFRATGNEPGWKLEIDDYLRRY